MARRQTGAPRRRRRHRHRRHRHRRHRHRRHRPNHPRHPPIRHRCARRSSACGGRWSWRVGLPPARPPRRWRVSSTRTNGFDRR
ncbi:MAG TPA: hypothetical protein ENK57_01225 [Polyangiaceae bacterium]|nr:hypothetical protein [Polyangiaceae bacterium]